MMRQVHPLGVVTDIWRYPIKSLAPEALDAVDCDECGLAGDRRSALVVATPGHARAGKTYRGKEHALLHTRATVDEATALGAERSVMLDVRTDGPFFDLDPVSIVVDTWLRDGERLVRRSLEPLRFRPNLYVRAAPDFHAAENALIDRVLAVGDVRLRVSQPILRCITPSYDLRTGESDPRILSVIANERANTMGVYAHVVRGSTLRANDAITFASD